MEPISDPGGSGKDVTADDQDLSRLRHDLNNSLTAIFGLVDLILIKEKGLTEDGRRRIEMIATTCTRMLDRIGQARGGAREAGDRGGAPRGRNTPEGS